MRFESIPGQTELKKVVEKQLQIGKWPHSTIICGPVGVPTLAFSLAIARNILTTGLNELDAPNTHGKVDKLIHPDLHFSFPFQGSKHRSDDFLAEWRQCVLANPFLTLRDWASVQTSETKTLNIPVLECHNIIQKLSLKAFEGGAKIMIIWGPEFLGNEGNRLLKLIEEPPENTYFLLVTEKVDALLPTILSRCQIYKLMPLAGDEVASWLVNSQHLAAVRAESIANLSEGSLSRAIELMSTNDESSGHLVSEWWSLIRRGDFEGLLEYAAELNALNKEKQKIVLQMALVSLRNRLHKVDLDDAIFADDQDPYDLEFVERMNVTLNELVEGLERNAHFQSLFMSKSIEMWRWARKRVASNI